MYQLLLNGKEVSYSPNQRVIDLLTEQDKSIYFMCEVNGVTKELTYPLSEKLNNSKINLLKLDNIQSSKAYESTLRFVISMAFKKLYPELDIKFTYNASRSIFCTLVNQTLNINKYSEPVIKEVKRLVNANLEIKRYATSIDEAIKIYESLKMNDKIRILKYRQDKIVHMYECDGYYDYMYNYMLPSTGYLKNYLIKPYSPGLIIQYPRYELDAKIPEFIEESTYGKTLKKAGKWAHSTNTSNIVNINQKLENESITDFIQACETKHNNMLAELGNEIKKEIEDVRLICIAGPSSSGKTTFCNRLRIELLSLGITPVMISLDDYYFERAKICEIQKTTMDNLDLEHINCLDIELFNQNMFDLINGEEVTLPHFNFQTGKREAGRKLKLKDGEPIMIEGIHALNEKLTASIPKHQKFKIYIAPQMQINIDDHSPLSTTDLRLIRRIVRDMKFRNCPATGTINMWQSVRDGEFKWIYPNQEGANYVFNSELSYELCVFKKYALPELAKIVPGDAEYPIANRLIKYLKYFDDINDETAIPCNSLIREFIGGSCFNV